jgi:hypothetical protein
MAVALGLAAVLPAAAGATTLSLTLAGAGFTLTTAIGGYAYTGYYDYQFGSLAVNNAGQLVGHTGGDSYVFTNTDNQTIANALSSAPVTGFPSSVGLALARSGGVLYGSQAFGSYYVLNQNGTIASTLTLIPNATSIYGLWANPVNGHLLSSGGGGLIDIDPTNGSWTQVISTSDIYDGVTVSPDGITAYVADTTNSVVRGFTVMGAGYGTQTFTSSFLGTGPDGMGVLAGTCAQAGKIVLNNNDGTVGLIDPAVNGSGQTVIASGGNRGDYASLDTSNGTLFLSQNDQIARLQAPVGCSIGTTITDTPEPASLLVLAMGLLGLTAVLRRPAPARART